MKELPYRAIVENSLDAIALIHRDSTTFYASPSITRVLGYLPEEFLGRSVFDFIHPEDLDRSRELFSKALESPGTPIIAEVRCRHSDGSWRLMEVIGVNRFDDPEVGALVANYRDITERKRLEDALRESEERFRVAAQISSDLIYEWDITTGSVLFLHESGGTHSREVPRSREAWEEILHPEDRDRVLAAVQRTLETDQPFFEEYRVVLGGAVLVRTGYGKVLRDTQGRPVKWIGINKDATDRRRMEEALRESEQRLRTLVDNVPLVLFAFDNDGVFTHSEGKGLQALGWQPGEAVGRSVADLYARHPDAVALAARALRGEAFTGTVRLGNSIFDLRFAPRADRNGNRTGVIGVAMDVTEHRCAEEALRTSEDRYRTLFERNLAGVYRSTIDGRILQCNDTFARMYGYESCEETLSVNARDLYFSAQERETFLEELRKKGFLLNYEARGRRKDGSSFWMIENVTLNPAGQPQDVIEGTILDITARKEAEEQLSTSRERLRKLSWRLEAAREEERTRIAREIHDELGQRLTALKMSVSRLRKGLAPEAAVLRSESRAILESIDELLRTVRDLSTQLRPAVLDHLDLDDAVKWQARDFESKTGIRCEVISRLDGLPIDSRRTTDLFRVVQEALTNVVRHARASRVQIQILREAGDLLLEVGDNGQGTSDEDLNRPASLGLLGIRERIEALGGDVQLVSAPGKGTRVRVRVPLRRRGAGHEEDSDRR